MIITLGLLILVVMLAIQNYRMGKAIDKYIAAGKQNLSSNQAYLDSSKEYIETLEKRLGIRRQQP